MKMGNCLHDCQVQCMKFRFGFVLSGILSHLILFCFLITFLFYFIWIKHFDFWI